MRLIDADDLFAKVQENAPGFMDSGSTITKAFIMAMINTKSVAPTIDAVKVVRCKNCQHWKPPHISLNDGRQRLYREGEKDKDPFGIGVTCDVGINVGGKCWLEHNSGYGRDMRVFREADDYCSRADKLPDGKTPAEWWGLSTEPAELRDD